jgi:predicted nucleotidyltransferase
MPSINEFLELFVAWAANQPDIHAVALVGSYARNAATVSSDLDLVILAAQPARYLDDTGWTEQFGMLREQQIEDYGKLISIRVFYTDEPEVEYGITDESWAALPLDPGSQQVIAAGMKVLFEREPLLSRHL